LRCCVAEREEGGKGGGVEWAEKGGMKGNRGGSKEERGLRECCHCIGAIIELG
jgi:hypothetical protein